MVLIRLYTKEGCGLCDEVKHDLAELQARFPHQLEEIDIMLDTAVFEAYKHSIPVIEIEDNLLQAPITKANLEATFRKVYEVEEWSPSILQIMYSIYDQNRPYRSKRRIW